MIIYLITMSTKFLIFCFTVNLISLAHGCAVGIYDCNMINSVMLIRMCFTGWLSPSLLYLKSSESHLQNGAITNEESSWIGKKDW